MAGPDVSRSTMAAAIPAGLKTAGLTAAAMVAFAANSLLCRAALGGGHADATSFTLLRLAGGTLALGLVARWRGGSAPPARLAWGSAAVLFAYAIGFSLAYTRVSAGTGALLLFAAVQLSMIGAALRGGERPRGLEWTGLALSAGGLVVLALPGLARPDLVGGVLMLGAGAAWGLYSLLGRRAKDAVATNASSFARTLPLALAASGLAAAAGAAHVTATGVALALTSGSIASGLAYAVWYAALRGLGGTRAAIVQLSVPVLAAAGGVLFLGEHLTARLLLAGVLVLGGIALAVRGRARR